MADHKSILLKRKEELRQNLKDIEEAAKPVQLEESIGRLSRMDAIQQQQVALNSKKQILNNLEQVEQALNRLEEGEFGICLICEEEIDERRLKAKPEAPFCISCQETHQNKSG